MIYLITLMYVGLDPKRYGTDDLHDAEQFGLEAERLGFKVEITTLRALDRGRVYLANFDAVKEYEEG